MSDNDQMVPESGRLITRALNTRSRVSNRGTENSMSYINKEGKRFPVAITVSPIISDKELIGAVEVFEDVTEEKRIEKSKTEFVSLASHQLRTPLSAINWYTEMLMGEDVGSITEKQKQYLKEIYNSSQRMVNLVGSLLNVSRIDLGVFAIEPKPTDINQLINQILEDCKHRVAGKDIEVTRVLEENLGLINVDQNLLSIVVENLMSNAWKYTPSGGNIRVEVNRVDNEVVIRVRDSGCGIPLEQQKKVFEKFFRADNVRLLETDGNGLGLYMVKQIVEKSGGHIRFESEEGRGTTFFVSLPISGMISRSGGKKLV